MKYYIYKVDLDVMDKLKELKNDEEKGILILKTNGQCILEYTNAEYDNILNEIGEENANILEHKFLSLIDIKTIYDNVKLTKNNGYIREFKLKIYPAITECKGLVILEEDEPKSEEGKKWFEFWKK